MTTTKSNATGTIKELAELYGCDNMQMNGAIGFLTKLGKCKKVGYAERPVGARGKAAAIYKVEVAPPINRGE